MGTTARELQICSGPLIPWVFITIALGFGGHHFELELELGIQEDQK